MIDDVVGKYEIVVEIQDLYPPGFCESEGIEQKKSVYVTMSHDGLVSSRIESACAFVIPFEIADIDPNDFINAYLRTAIYETMCDITRQKKENKLKNKQ